MLVNKLPNCFPQETTALSLFWALMYIAKYPEVQKKLQKEADTLLPKDFSNQDLEKLDIGKFEYTQNFVKEVLRHRPVGPLNGGTALKDTVIGGYHVPKGTDIFMLTRLGGFLATPTPDPLCFNPDRWNIEKTNPELYKIQSNVSMGFGSGPRICPGRHLAMMEMVIMVACVFSSFDIEFFPAPTGHEEIHEVVAFTQKPENLYLRLKTRKC
jgi:cytochrome P450